MRRWNEEMLTALVTRDTQRVIRMLNTGFPQNFPLKRKDESGAVVLNRTFCSHLAAEFGLLDVFLALQEAGADWEMRDSLGRSPLLVAAQFGHLEAMKQLVTTHKASIGARDQEGNTVLHLAAAHGHLQICQYLVETLAFPLDVKNTEGRTALDLCSAKEEQSPIPMQLTLGTVVTYLTSIKQAESPIKSNPSIFSSPAKSTTSPSIHHRCKNEFRRVEWAKDQGMEVLDNRRGNSLSRRLTFKLVARDSLGPLQPLIQASPGSVDRVIKERCDLIYERFMSSRLVYLSTATHQPQAIRVPRAAVDSRVSRYTEKAHTVT